MSIQSINPATEEVIETFEVYTPAQVNQALEQAHTAFFDWRETTFAERATILHRVASYLREHKVELARLATLEMGKPIIESEAEVEKCAWNCDFYADNAEKFLSDEHIASSATESYVSYLPWCDFGFDALEFSLLASIAFCRACIWRAIQSYSSMHLTSR